MDAEVGGDAASRRHRPRRSRRYRRGVPHHGKPPALVSASWIRQPEHGWTSRNSDSASCRVASVTGEEAATASRLRAGPSSWSWLTILLSTATTSVCLVRRSEDWSGSSASSYSIRSDGSHQRRRYRARKGSRWLLTCILGEFRVCIMHDAWDLYLH